MAAYLIEQHGLGRYPLEKLITTYKIADFEAALQYTKAGKTIKAVLDWS